MKNFGKLAVLGAALAVSATYGFRLQCDCKSRQQ